MEIWLEDFDVNIRMAACVVSQVVFTLDPVSTARNKFADRKIQSSRRPLGVGSF